MSCDLPFHYAPTTTEPAAVDRPSRSGLETFLPVVLAWALAIAAASIYPVDNPQLARAALFVHLMSMAVGFGSVVMIDAYGLMWLFGQKKLAEMVDLANVAHAVIGVAVGGLLASGIALRPELGAPITRLKMVLVLVLMLNGVAAQRMLHRMRDRLPPETTGDSIPWTGFQRALAAALVSQATWWGSIAIGFLTSAGRH